jgi:hypothetical protein
LLQQLKCCCALLTDIAAGLLHIQVPIFTKLRIGCNQLQLGVSGVTSKLDY